MATFEVKLRDGTVEWMAGADAYQPDGQLTTFFAFEEGRSAVDCWSVRGSVVITWDTTRPNGSMPVVASQRPNTRRPAT